MSISTRRLFPVVLVLLALVGPLALEASAQSRLDAPEPESNRFLYDYADLISSEYADKIRQHQKAAHQKHDTTIVGVVIESKAEYGGQSLSIEQFARNWFDDWEIGKTDRSGKLYDRGILIVISRDDREARIELGREWGHRWDEYCQQVMDRKMIPAFKKKEYGKGLEAAVMAAYEMAKLGPEAEPPEAPGFFDDPVSSIETFEPKTSFFSGWQIAGIMLLGVFLIIAGIVVEDETATKWLIIG
ncbi:MAG: TPM domain-containing protein, partial [Persicimonas sp.]